VGFNIIYVTIQTNEPCFITLTDNSLAFLTNMLVTRCSVCWIQNTDMFSPSDFAGLRTFQADKVGTEHIKGTQDGAGTRLATVTYDFLWRDLKLLFFSGFILTSFPSCRRPHLCRRFRFSFNRGVKLKGELLFVL